MKVDKLPNFEGAILHNGYVVEQPFAKELAESTKEASKRLVETEAITKDIADKMCENIDKTLAYGWQVVTCKTNLEHARKYAKTGYRIFPAQFVANDKGYCNLDYIITGEEVK